MNKKQKIIVSVVGITIVLLTLLGLTYAYFLTRIQGNTNEKSISVTTADLKLVYDDGSDGVVGGENLLPSDTVYTKTFTVRNEGNANVEYGVYLIDVINTLVRKDDVKYTLNCTTDGTITCNKVTTETTFPSGINQLITNEIEPGKTHTYTFTFTYKDTGIDQSIDMGKELSAKLQIFGKQSNGEYFPYSENTMAYTIINNVKSGTLEGKSTFSENLSATNMIETKSTASDKILSTAEDDGGTTYYFRGNPIDNYVNYAGMCWRIVRIQGDGSIKLILASEKTCSTTNLTTNSGYATDGAAGTQGTILTANYGYKIVNIYNINDYINSYKINDYINSASSTNNARTKLNAWLERKITNESDKALLKNETWCIGDQTNAYDTAGKVIGTVSDLINSETTFYFTAGNKYFVTKTPSYKCETTGVDGEIEINKVGMLTFDEIVYAGGGDYTNSNYYLNNNATTKYWWALSPNFFDSEGYVNSFLGNDDGNVSYSNVAGVEALRPAVSLLSSTQITGGNGTVSNPYTVS